MVHPVLLTPVVAVDALQAKLKIAMATAAQLIGLQMGSAMMGHIRGTALRFT